MGSVLGLLSDSHGRANATRLAVRALVEAGADAIVHLGDVCSLGVIDELAGVRAPDGRPVPARLVFGNVDCEVASFTRYAHSLGVAVDHPAGRIVMSGRLIMFHHGHEEHREREAIDAGADFYLHGHTHRLRDETVGSTRIINPGALHRARRHTAAALECETGRLRILDVTAPE